VSLSLDEVRHVAELARLTLTEAEERLYQTQLSAILDAMAQLRAVDTEGVEPTSHPTSGEPASAERADEPRASLDPERALANAPARVGTHFAVPKVLE
jgi:aspartyl-tRNA(Asn)/glutamyl-tRNA(Gln) amidotransferase subunit C